MIAIFATDLAHGFGINGHLPWTKMPEDMDHFRSITHGKHIIMGYNTWKTLPSLPYRTSVVITRFEISSALCMPHSNYVQHIKDLESDLGQEVVVIGGAKILTPELLNSCSAIYHTSVKGTFAVDTRMSADSMATLKGRAEEILLETDRCIIRKYS
jgi:dihydrofolate reductase